MCLAGTRPPLVHHCLVVSADGSWTLPSHLTAPRQRLSFNMRARRHTHVRTRTHASLRREKTCRRMLHGQVNTIAHRCFDLQSRGHDRASVAADVAFRRYNSSWARTAAVSLCPVRVTPAFAALKVSNLSANDTLGPDPAHMGTDIGQTNIKFVGTRRTGDRFCSRSVFTYRHEQHVPSSSAVRSQVQPRGLQSQTPSAQQATPCAPTTAFSQRTS